MDLSRAAPELKEKAAQVFPLARTVLPRAAAAGVRICCGTDAPAIPHGDNANELVAALNVTPALCETRVRSDGKSAPNFPRPDANPRPS